MCIESVAIIVNPLFEKKLFFHVRTLCSEKRIFFFLNKREANGYAGGSKTERKPENLFTFFVLF